MSDDRLVISPGGAPPTPAEQAVLGYLEQRKMFPLPDGWTQRFELVPADSVGAEPTPDSREADAHGRDHLIACYLEDSEYAVELLFMAFPQSSVRPGDRSPVGGFRLEFYRKDGAAPTTLEVGGMCGRFGARPFGRINVYPRAGYLDGDPRDRPWPTAEGRVREATPDAPETRIVHFALDAAPRQPSVEDLRAVRGVTIPTVQKSNTRAAFKEDLRHTVERHMRTLRRVQHWIDCRCGMIWPDVPEADRGEACREAQRLEQRYGIHRLEALAGIPVPLTRLDVDVQMHDLGAAHHHVWGQLAATERLLRRVTSERF